MKRFIEFLSDYSEILSSDIYAYVTLMFSWMALTSLFIAFII